MPPQAYVFRTGKRKGKSLPLLVFNDPLFLIQYYYQLCKLADRVPATRIALQQCTNLAQVVHLLGRPISEAEKNAPHRQLEWLLPRLDTIASPRLCPRCHQRPIAQASLLSGSSITYALCNNWQCMDSVKAEAVERSPAIVPLSFFQVFRGSLPAEFRQKMARLLRTIHFGQARINGQTIINYFA